MSLFLTDANKLILGIITLLSILLYPNFVMLKESPMWLLRQKRFKEAVEVFSEIAKVNGRPLPPIYFDKFRQSLEENQVQQKEDDANQKLSIGAKLRLLFLNNEYLKPLLILSVTSASLFCVYYGMTTSVQDMGLSTVQLNGMVVGVTQAAGFIIVLRHLPKTRRKVALLAIQGLLLTGAYLLICVSFLPKGYWVNLLNGFVSTVCMSTVLSSMFSFLYVANAESFPTQIRGLAVGIILLTGKLLGSCAPYINLFSKHMKVHVMVGSSLPLFISIIACMFLKETLAVGNKKQK